MKSRKAINLKAPQMIKDTYSKVDSSNKIGSIDNVYPAGAIAAFQAHPGLHLLIDEFRHFLYASIEEINCRPNARDQAQAFNDLVLNVNCFRSLLYPSKSLIDKFDVCDKSKSVMQIQEPFWDDFALHIPCTYFDENDKRYAYTGGDDDDDVPPEAEHEEALDQMEGDSTDEEEGKELARKLQAWLDAKGDLPEGVEGWKCEKTE